nr:uncharacterized protein LOC108402430 [Manis javanica]
MSGLKARLPLITGDLGRHLKHVTGAVQLHPWGGGQSPSQPRCLPSAWPRGRLTGGAEGTQGSSYALRCCARGWAPPRSDPQPPGLPAAPQSRPGGPPLGTEPPASGSSAAPLPPRADPAFSAGARRRTPRSRGSLCPSGARTAERIQGPEAEAGARVSLGLVPSPGWAFHEASSVSSCASVPPRSFSSMWATAWKGALAAQVPDVEGLDYSSSVDSVPGPLDLTHSAIGETSPSLCCCSQIGPQSFPVATCWHFVGLLASCPSSRLPLLLEQTPRLQVGLWLVVVVSPTLMFGIPDFTDSGSDEAF